MAWKIDRDYIFDPSMDDRSNVGTASLGADLGDETFRFRLRDDDENVYYGGVADADAALEDEDLEHGGLTEAWQWGMYDSGAVDLQVRVRDALKYNLTSRAYVDKFGLTDSNWVSIFG